MAQITKLIYTDIETALLNVVLPPYLWFELFCTFSSSESTTIQTKRSKCSTTYFFAGSKFHITCVIVSVKTVLFYRYLLFSISYRA